MDAYSRRIIGYCGADNLRAENALRALRMAFSCRGVSDYRGGLIHHTDRGTQYTANEYTGALDGAKIGISMCQSALENAYIERVHGTIKNQYLIHRPIDSLDSLRYWLDRDVHTYNHYKPHSRLGDKTPVEFEDSLSIIPISQRATLRVFTKKSGVRNTTDSNQLSLFCTI